MMVLGIQKLNGQQLLNVWLLISFRLVEENCPEVIS